MEGPSPTCGVPGPKASHRTTGLQDAPSPGSAPADRHVDLRGGGVLPLPPRQQRVQVGQQCVEQGHGEGQDQQDGFPLLPAAALRTELLLNLAAGTGLSAWLPAAQRLREGSKHRHREGAAPASQGCSGHPPQRPTPDPQHRGRSSLARGSTHRVHVLRDVVHGQHAAQHRAQRDGPGQQQHGAVPQALAEAAGARAGALLRQQLLQESGARAAQRAPGLSCSTEQDPGGRRAKRWCGVGVRGICSCRAPLCRGTGVLSPGVWAGSCKRLHAPAAGLRACAGSSSPAAHLQLGADVLALQLHRAPLDHLEVPGTEDFDRQVPCGAAHAIALPEGAGHAAARGRRQGIGRGRLAVPQAMLTHLYTSRTQVTRKETPTLKT